MTFAFARRLAAGAGLVALAAAALVHHHFARPQILKPGDRLVPLAVTSLEGANATLLPAGRPQLLNVFATWCPPCRAEMPDLQRLYQAYAPREVVVLGVDQGESAQRVAAFAQSLGIHYPILLDQQQQYGRVYAALGLPTTIVVNQQGVVVRGFDGPLSYPQMVAAITPLLGK